MERHLAPSWLVMCSIQTCAHLCCFSSNINSLLVSNQQSTCCVMYDRNVATGCAVLSLPATAPRPSSHKSSMGGYEHIYAFCVPHLSKSVQYPNRFDGKARHTIIPLAQPRWLVLRWVLDIEHPPQLLWTFTLLWIGLEHFLALSMV